MCGGETKHQICRDSRNIYEEEMMIKEHKKLWESIRVEKDLTFRELHSSGQSMGYPSLQQPSPQAYLLRDLLHGSRPREAQRYFVKTYEPLDASSSICRKLIVNFVGTPRVLVLYLESKSRLVSRVEISPCLESKAPLMYQVESNHLKVGIAHGWSARLELTLMVCQMVSRNPQDPSLIQGNYPWLAIGYDAARVCRPATSCTIFKSRLYCYLPRTLLEGATSSLNASLRWHNLIKKER